VRHLAHLGSVVGLSTVVFIKGTELITKLGEALALVVAEQADNIVAKVSGLINKAF